MEVMGMRHRLCGGVAARVHKVYFTCAVTRA